MKKYRKVARLVILLNHKNGKREIDTKDSFQEVGPLVRNPPKSLWNKLFYRNFIGIVRVQSFVPKDSIGKFPIGYKSYKNPPFPLYSKGGLSVLELDCFDLHGMC
jgi:hypothetical protein